MDNGRLKNNVEIFFFLLIHFLAIYYEGLMILVLGLTYGHSQFLCNQLTGWLATKQTAPNNKNFT